MGRAEVEHSIRNFVGDTLQNAYKNNRALETGGFRSIMNQEKNLQLKSDPEPQPDPEPPSEPPWPDQQDEDDGTEPEPDDAGDKDKYIF